MRSKKMISQFTHGCALAVALILFLSLIVAATGKIFYPHDLLLWLERGVGFFEVVVACLLLFFYRNWHMWAGMSLILASWAGYSLFWLFQKLPCSCLGTLMELPGGCTFSFDVFFFFAAMLLNYFLGIGKVAFYAVLCVSALVGVGGYFVGDWVYQTFLLAQLKT
jgi:hypothetical protein